MAFVNRRGDGILFIADSTTLDPHKLRAKSSNSTKIKRLSRHRHPPRPHGCHQSPSRTLGLRPPNAVNTSSVKPEPSAASTIPTSAPSTTSNEAGSQVVNGVRLTAPRQTVPKRRLALGHLSITPELLRRPLQHLGSRFPPAAGTRRRTQSTLSLR